MNKAKHTDVQFCKFEKASKLVNDPRFVSIEEFSDESFEVIIYCVNNFNFNIVDNPMNIYTILVPLPIIL